MKKAFFPLLPLALGLVLMACNQNPTPPEAIVASPEAPVRQPTAFEHAVMDLKARNLDQEESNAAIRALMAKHGYPAPAQAPAPLMPVTVPEPTKSAPAGGLAKTAASQVYIVKNFDFGFTFVVKKVITVPNNVSLEAWTTRDSNQTGTDPRLVAFYKEVPENRTRVQVVGFNDDYNGLDSRFTWKNTTGSNKMITLYGFAYSTASGGNATLSGRLFTNVNPQLARFDVKGGMLAVGVFKNLPVQTVCSDAVSSTISLKRLMGGGYGSGVLAVNPATMRGGLILESGPSLVLQDLLPSGGNNMVLGFFEGDGTGMYDMTRFNAKQEDLYIGC